MGIGSHQSANAKKDEWLTPPQILQALGTFDLDPCAPVPENRPWPMAREHYTVNDNGLVKAWHGRVWCNPPYGQATGTWLGRLADHGNGIALIFARTETDMFFKQVWDRADAVLFIRGRLFFHVGEDTTFEQNGKKIFIQRGDPAPANSGAPSVLVAYGKDNVTALEQSGITGKLVILRTHGGANNVKADRTLDLWAGNQGRHEPPQPTRYREQHEHNAVCAHCGPN